MASDEGLVRETLRAFIASVAEGSHVAVRLESLTPREALRLCEDAARESGERFLADPQGLELARLDLARLRALADEAAADARGLLVAVDGASALARNAAAHAHAERALGSTVAPNVRIFCFYDGVAKVPRDVLVAHRELLDGRSWQVA